ncbi:hypothetical protein Tco_0460751, partial [Tanacetum coccineum]
VIVGSFVPSSEKQTKTVGNNEVEVVNAPASESSGGGLSSPLDHSNNSNPQAMANMPWKLTPDHPVVCKRTLLY